MIYSTAVLEVDRRLEPVLRGVTARNVRSLVRQQQIA